MVPSTLSKKHSLGKRGQFQETSWVQEQSRMVLKMMGVPGFAKWLVPTVTGVFDMCIFGLC